jgi:alpha-tubulin suppressor-like RCC1 family protein
LGVLAAALASVQCLDRAFTCQSHAQCKLLDVVGVCEPDRRCSFPDATCSSGRRYGAYGTDTACVDAACGGAGAPCCEKETCQVGLMCAEGKCQCAAASIASGDSHTCVGLRDGRVTCVGNNGSGQLGDGTYASRSEPKEVPELVGVVQVASYDTHTCALVQGGTVSCWGSNSRGQLGDGTMTPRPTPKPVSRLGGVVEVAVGARHGCARRADGGVLCWGDNLRGQLGDGSLIPRLVPDAVRGLPAPADEIAAGEEFSCARLRTGQVACWGANSRREIDVAADAQYVSPKLVAGVDGVVQLVLGATHACVRKADGAVLCWGAAAQGQTGRGTMPMFAAAAPVMMVDKARAIASGKSHACALLDGERMACWGSNGYAQLGAERPDTALVPVASALGGALALAGGGRHTCARLTNGTVSCWGDRSEGQLGDAFPAAVTKPARVDLADVIEVSAGAAHTCALNRAGAVACWGLGSFNRLGDRDTRSRSAPTPVAGLAGVAQIASGGEFTCARRQDGVVLCWGRGDSGQVGDGMRKNQAMPQPVMLPDRAVDLAAGATHACAVVAGRVHCWGSNSRAQTGTPTAAGMGADLQLKPVEVLDLEDVAEVAAGNGHTCARRADGRVLCWGAAESGQLGLAATTTRPMPTLVEDVTGAVEIAAGASHTCARLGDGSVRCWGAGTYGQLGAGVTTDRNPRSLLVLDLPGPAVHISAGGAFSCAVSERGTACWGQNRHGEVGDGTQVQRTAPVAVAGLQNAAALGLGDAHACAVTTGNELFCWGRHQNGEVGTGEPLLRATPAPMRLGCRVAAVIAP